MLDEIYQATHNSASLLFQTRRSGGAAKAKENTGSLKINSR
jgi:hypothetical protein